MSGVAASALMDACARLSLSELGRMGLGSVDAAIPKQTTIPNNRRESFCRGIAKKRD